jgi:hypothetical protein
MNKHREPEPKIKKWGQADRTSFELQDGQDGRELPSQENSDSHSLQQQSVNAGSKT